MYIPIDQFEQFNQLKEYPRDSIIDSAINTASNFHEINDLEEFLLKILSDPNRTPHGPIEIADILTLQLTYRRKADLAAFVLKGRSFKSVTPSDISHQVFRLRKLADLKYAILGHVGNLLDAARDEFIQTATDLEIDYSIIDSIDFARIAIGLGVLCPRDGLILTDGRCNCGYTAAGDLINYLQKEALTRLRESHELGQEYGLVIMPTGSGKTRIASIDSNYLQSKRILYVAHTHEILDVANREFGQVFGCNKIYKGWIEIPQNAEEYVQLSTIQSIRKNLDRFEYDTFDYVIIDEFHHAAAPSYRNLISKIRPQFLLGLTATPFRLDKQDVMEICQGNIIVNFELRSGIDAGVLVPFHYYGLFDDINYSILKRIAGSYSTSDLNKALIIPERDKSIINEWTEYAQDLPTIAFCCSRKHAKRMFQSFRENGISAKVYLGTTRLDSRLDIIEQLQFGDIKVICAVDVLNEGVDIPFVECLLFLRPTESKRIFFQQLGRGLRKSPGKDHVIVLDFIGNFQNSYMIPEYLGLNPEDHFGFISTYGTRSSKEIINLPLGCEVYFDDRVIDIFANQIIHPNNINRENIAQILIYLYRKTSRHLGRPASRKEVDRLQFLHSDFYKWVFGSWKAFEKMMEKENKA